MRLRLLPLLPLVAAPAALRAQPPAPPADTSVHLTVTPDRADWRYRLGDSARFRVALDRGGRPVPGARVRVELAQERMAPVRRDTLDAAAPRTVGGTLRTPGFLRATATAVVDGATYTQLATAAFEPERIEATTTEPADFDAFWTKAIADARRVPMQPVLTRLPARSTPEVDVYHVNFQNDRVGSRLYGMLSVPTKPGRHPAVLTVPGAGVRPYFPNVRLARQGVVHLAIGIHGIPVDRDSLLYNELRATALRDYARAGIEDRNAYYYRRVFVGVVRAGDFLMSLPQVDSTRYLIEGGSQGGALAIAGAVLDRRIIALAASYPALSDHFGYLRGRAGGWPHVLADTAGMKALPEKMETLRYYDVVNFARRLRVPGIYAWGFNDTVVPPTSVYAAYNLITAPKETVIAPETGHYRVPEQNRRIDAWMLARLGVAPTP